AWQRAWRPPLRIAFEDLARADRVQALLDGRVLPEDDEASATVEGVLRSDASPSASGVSLSLDVHAIAGQHGWEGREGQEGLEGQERRERRDGRESLGGIVVTVVGSMGPTLMDGWRAGRTLRMPVQLHRPARYLDPGVPDHERALARRGTTLVGSVQSGALVEIASRGGPIDEWLAAVRAYARRAIAAAVGRWSSRSAGIVAAIVIGDRGGLDADVQRRLQEAGTYHVIAISGGNIAILAGLLIGFFRIAGVLGRTAMLTAIATLIAYAALVGGGASVDRATLMAVIYFAARAVDQRSPPLNTLALVAACLVAADPLSVTDPAFVLTFGATLAILLVVPIVQRWRLPRMARAPAAMLAASIATEALLYPIGAIIFSRITFAGLALNFLAIPLMGVAQIAGMVVVPAALISTGLAAACGWIAHAGADGLVMSADLVRFAPALTYRVAAPNAIVCAAYYVALAVTWTMWRRRVVVVGSAESASARRWRRGALGVAAAAAVWVLVEPWAMFAARGDGRLHVTFIDVGQGDAALLRFPRGSTLLVDTGGLSASSSFDIGDRVVAPVLRDAGVRRLDYLALTHGDPDHIGGASSILAEFRPREVWEGIPVPRFEPLTSLRAQAAAAGCRWANVYSGDHVVIDGVDVRAVHPEAAEWERQKVRNDDSIVLDLRWRDVSVLLTGDIGKPVERTLGQALAPAAIRVIKVPHHGSPTSSTEEFLRAAKPSVAIFSAGRANHFGHPAPAVVERYKSIRAQIFRTDRDGAVRVDTDGYSIDVHTFLGRRVELSGSVMNHEETKGTKR
ncbi:MAG TPA: DNA internalization-related competence protein ComEC/Rec2, partial [Vicinamibacterales bacterium]|nr:DNA internalization-related competence protein ComEC/Rec2 [Vicinamibacterales bacterium]